MGHDADGVKRIDPRRVPPAVAAFLGGRRIVVAGVARDGRSAANAIFRKLQGAGYDVVPLNPHTETIENARCYPDIQSVPGSVDGIVIATPPEVAAGIVEQGATRGVRRVWFHRSFGTGSVSSEAVGVCRARGIDCIVGGCPLMFCPPVDLAHRCMRWWLQRRGRVPR